MNSHAIDCFFIVLFFYLTNFGELLYVAVIYIAKSMFEVHAKTVDITEVFSFD